MKKILCLVLTIPLLILSSCQSETPGCQWGTGTPHFIQSQTEQAPTGTPGPSPTPVTMEIRRKSILVDKVVDGPLCNDTWSGTVYVTCSAQVQEWMEEPLFFKDCELVIEPGTVVYVAYHNDTAYYNGCSCHTGVEGTP